MKSNMILKSLIILAFVATGCNKDDDNTDPECVKDNYFKAEFDEEVIEPKWLTGGGIAGYTLHVARNEEDRADWNITVLNGNNMSFYLTILNIQGPGTYQFESGSQDDLPHLPTYYPKTFILVDKYVHSLSYYFSIENTGSIEIIEYNEEEGILVGTFSCNLYSSSNPDIVKPISGEFSINLSTLDINEKPCWM